MIAGEDKAVHEDGRGVRQVLMVRVVSGLERIICMFMTGIEFARSSRRKEKVSFRGFLQSGLGFFPMIIKRMAMV